MLSKASSSMLSPSSASRNLKSPAFRDVAKSRGDSSSFSYVEGLLQARAIDAADILQNEMKRGRVYVECVDDLLHTYDGDISAVYDFLVNNITLTTKPSNTIGSSSTTLPASPRLSKIITSSHHLNLLLHGLLLRVNSEMKVIILDYVLELIDMFVINLDKIAKSNVLALLIASLLSGNLIMNNKKVGVNNKLDDYILPKLIQLIETMSCHCITTHDLGLLFTVFKLHLSESMHFFPHKMLSMMVSISKKEKEARTPPAYWNLNNSDAGLLISNFNIFPRDGYSFGIWIRIEQYPVDAAVIPLYSFKAANGQGVDAYFQNRNTLVLRTQLDEKKPRQTAVPLSIVLKQWHFITVSHVRKSMWRSSIDVYLDGIMQYSNRHAYPSTGEMLISDTCCIGTLPESGGKSSCKGYSMQISCAALFKEAFSNIEVIELLSFMAPPRYMLSPLSVSEDSTLKSKHLKLLDKLLCGYDARNVFALNAFDAGKHRFHASLGPETELITCTRFSQSMSAIGGAASLLPLLLPPDNSSAYPTSLECRTKLPKQLVIYNSRMTPPEFAEVVSLIALLANNSSKIKPLIDAGGLRTIAALLRESPVEYQTPDLLNAVRSLVDAVSFNPGLKKIGYQCILFDFSMWSSASFPIQMLWLGSIVSAVKDNCSELHNWIGIQKVLDALLFVYYFDQKPASNLIIRPRAKDLSHAQISQLRECVIDILEMFMMDRTSGLTKSEANALGVFMSPPTPHEQLHDVLSLLLKRINNTALLKSLREIGTAQILLHLLSSPIEDARILSCALLSFFCASCMSVSGKKYISPMINLDLLLGSRKIPPGTTFKQLLYVHLEESKAPLTMPMYRALMDFALNLPFGTTESASIGDKPVTAVQPIIFDSVFFVILKLLPQAVLYVQKQALRDILVLITQQSKSYSEFDESISLNIEKMANQDCWIRSLSHLIISPDPVISELAMDIASSVLYWVLVSFHDGSNAVDIFRVELEITVNEVLRSQLGISDRGYSQLDYLKISTTFQTILLQKCSLKLQTKQVTRKGNHGNNTSSILWNNALRLAYQGIDFCLGDSPFLANNEWNDKSDVSSPNSLLREQRSRTHSYLGIDTSKRLRTIFVPYLLDYWENYLLPQINEGSDDKGLSSLPEELDPSNLISSRIATVGNEERPLYLGGAIRRIAWMVLKLLKQIIFSLSLLADPSRSPLVQEAVWMINFLSKLLISNKVLNMLSAPTSSYASPRDNKEFIFKFTGGSVLSNAEEKSRTASASDAFVLVPTYSENMFNFLLALQVSLIEMVVEINGRCIVVIDALLELFSALAKEVGPSIKDAVKETDKSTLRTSTDSELHVDDVINYQSMLPDVYSAVAERKAPEILSILSLENWTQMLKLPLFKNASESLREEMDDFQQRLLAYNVETRAAVLDDFDASINTYQNITVHDYECLLPFVISVEEDRINSLVKNRDVEFFHDSRNIFRYIRNLSNSIGVWEDVSNQDIRIRDKEHKFIEYSDKSLWKNDKIETGSRMRLMMRRNHREQTYVGYSRKESEVMSEEEQAVSGGNSDSDLPIDFKGVAVRVSKAKLLNEYETDEDDESHQSSSIAGEGLTWQEIESSRRESERKLNSNSGGRKQSKKNIVSGEDKESVKKALNLNSISNDDWDVVDLKRNPIDIEKNERLLYSISAELILPMCVVTGLLEVTSKNLFFNPDGFLGEGDNQPSHLKPRSWPINRIIAIYRRRYLLQHTALEIFFSDHNNFFFNFKGEKTFIEVHKYIMECKPPTLMKSNIWKNLYPPPKLIAKAEWTRLWVERKITNFEYLMALNTAAGRTYNDLTQYPIFPWVLADYSSEVLDLSNRASYRDLTKPIGALNEERLARFLERYNSFEDDVIPKFLYGTHYSNVGCVLFFMLRVEPFAGYAANLQGGQFDYADRLFHNINQAWNHCLDSSSDLKELIPEFFYLPDFLRNNNDFNLGTRQAGAKLGNVELPPWASSPEDFIQKQREALEGDYVSNNLHHWIDLIFGYKQQGSEAVAANNLFYYLTYEGKVDLEAISDPVLRRATESQIANFGQTPSQLFRTPHPRRLSMPEALSTAGYSTNNDKSFSADEILGWQVESLHDSPIEAIWFVPNRGSVISIDRDGKLGTMKYIPTIAMLVSNTSDSPMPFTLENMSNLKQIMAKESACRSLAWADAAFNFMNGSFTTSTDYSTAPSSPSESHNVKSTSPLTSTKNFNFNISESSPRKRATTSGLLNFSLPVLSPPELVRGKSRPSSLSFPPSPSPSPYFSPKSPTSSPSHLPMLTIPEDDDDTTKKREAEKESLFSLLRGRVALLVGGSILVSVGHWDSAIRLYNSDNGAELYRFQHHDEQVTAMNSSEDGKYIVCGYASGVVEVWDIEAAVSPSEDAGIVGAFFNALSGSGSKTNSKAQEDSIMHTLTGHTTPITSVSISHDINVVVSGSCDNVIIMHSLFTGEFIRGFHLNLSDVDDHNINYAVMVIKICSVGLIAVYSSIVDKKTSPIWNTYREINLRDRNESGMLNLCNVNGLVIKTIKTTGQPIFFLYISRDGRFILSATCSTIIIYKALTLEVINFVGVDPPSPFVSLAVSPDERSVITGLESGTFMTYKLDLSLTTVSGNFVSSNNIHAYN